MPEEAQTTEENQTTLVQPQSSSGESSVGVGQSSAYPTKAEFDTLAEKQKSDQNLLLVIMAGVVIFVAITFWIELSAMHRNYAEDKSLANQNNELNKTYFDKVLFLNNQISELRQELELLKARNNLR